MSSSSPTSVPFLTRILTSSFADQEAKRFVFPDGEVGIVYTLSPYYATGAAQPVLLLVATFPPSWLKPGVRDFGIDSYEYPVVSAQEAATLLAQFDHQQAAAFRLSCRPA